MVGTDNMNERERFALHGFDSKTGIEHNLLPLFMLYFLLLCFLSKGRVEGIVFQWLLCIRWGCQHSQIPSFLSLCSLLCVHLQFRSLLSKMILTGFGFMMSELKYVLHVHYGVCRNSPKEQLAESAMLPWDLRVDIIYFNVKNKCIL